MTAAVGTSASCPDRCRRGWCRGYRGADLSTTSFGDRDDGDRLRGCQILIAAFPAPRIAASPSLAVLHQLDRFPQRQVFDLGRSSRSCPARWRWRGRSARSRFRRPDGQRLALRSATVVMPASFRAGDLDIVGIDRGDDAQLGQRRLEAGIGIAFPCVFHGIAKREAQFALALLQQVQVLDRCLWSPAPACAPGMPFAPFPTAPPPAGNRRPRCRRSGC